MAASRKTSRSQSTKKVTKAIKNALLSEEIGLIHEPATEMVIRIPYQELDIEVEESFTEEIEESYH